MDYLNNLKKSLKTIINNKTLWIFAFIIALLETRSAFNFNYIFDILKPTNTNMSLISIDDSTKLLLLLLIIILLLALSLLFIYLSTRSEASLILSVSEIDDGKAMSLKKAWGMGNKGTIPLILMKILINLPIFLLSIIIFIVFGIVLISSVLKYDTENINPGVILISVLLFLIFILILIAYSIIASLIYTFASRKIVINGKGVFDSIRESATLIKDHLADILISILVSFLVLAPALAVIYLVSFAFIPLSLLLLPIYALLASANTITSILMLVFLIIIIYIVSGIFQSILVFFNSSYWTIVYKDIIKR